MFKMINNRHYNNILGIFLILAHTLSLAFLYTTKSVLVHQQGVPAGVVIFLFKFTTLIFILPWVFHGGIQNIKTKNLPLHIVRSFFSMFAGYFYAKSLMTLSASDATAIRMMEQMVLVLVGVFYFNERMTKTRLCAVIISFVGAMLIAKAKMIKGFDQGYLYLILAVVFWATNSTLVKVLGNRGATTKAQTFYVMLFSVIFASPLAFTEIIQGSFSIVEMTSLQLVLIVMLAIFYFIHTNCFFLALKNGEFPVIMPFDYFQPIFTFVVAVALSYQATFNWGYILIIISGVILTRYEAVKKIKAKRQQQQSENMAEVNVKKNVKIA